MERRVVDIAAGRRHLSKRRGALIVERDPHTPDASEMLAQFDEIKSAIVQRLRCYLV